MTATCHRKDVCVLSEPGQAQIPSGSLSLNHPSSVHATRSTLLARKPPIKEIKPFNISPNLWLVMIRGGNDFPPVPWQSSTHRALIPPKGEPVIWIRAEPAQCVVQGEFPTNSIPPVNNPLDLNPTARLRAGWWQCLQHQTLGTECRFPPAQLHPGRRWLWKKTIFYKICRVQQ